MAKQVYECTFNNSNGELTGVYTRPGMGASTGNCGILYKKNCPDGLHFYCDPEDGGKYNYYRLINPEEYKGIDASKGKVYVWLNKEHLSSWKLVDNPYEKKPEPEEPVVESSKPPVIPLPFGAGVLSSILATTLASTLTTTASAISKIKKKDTDAEGSQFPTQTVETQNSQSIKNNTTSKHEIDYEKNGYKRDSYFMDYSDFLKNLEVVEKNSNIEISTRSFMDVKDNMFHKFDRFHIAHPVIELNKSFAHVFFTRPDLNLFKDKNDKELLDNIKNDPFFYYLHKSEKDSCILKSLTEGFTSSHYFNPYLSNRAGSFELKDEFIETDEYGETYTGWKIKYGKRNIKSKTADSFSINYRDDNNYSVYKIHKAWTEYISNVYSGKFSAHSTNVLNRTIDYACSVYYILCAEDGETILFWTKYTGVFPTNAPSSASSWTSGNIVKLPEFSISYEYAWKEDMSPATLAEFNIVSGVSNGQYTYLNTYEEMLNSTGQTFVGAPYIESFSSNNGDYYFKLRFKEGW